MLTIKRLWSPPTRHGHYRRSTQRAVWAGLAFRAICKRHAKLASRHCGVALALKAQRDYGRHLLPMVKAARARGLRAPVPMDFLIEWLQNYSSHAPSPIQLMITLKVISYYSRQVYGIALRKDSRVRALTFESNRCARRRIAEPAALRDLTLKLLETQFDRVRDARDRAIICLLFADVPPEMVRAARVDALDRRDSYIRLHDPRRTWRYVDIYVRDDLLDPVRALERWLAVRPGRSPWIFSMLDQWQNLYDGPLSPQGLLTVVAARAEAARVHMGPDTFRQLLRHGCATFCDGSRLRIAPAPRRVTLARGWALASRELGVHVRAVRPLGLRTKKKYAPHFARALFRRHQYLAHASAIPIPIFELADAMALLRLIRWSRAQRLAPYRLTDGHITRWLASERICRPGCYKPALALGAKYLRVVLGHEATPKWYARNRAC